MGHLLDEVGVEGVCPGQGGRIDGGTEGGETGQTFFVRNRRYAESVGCHNLALAFDQIRGAFGNSDRGAAELTDLLPQAHRGEQGVDTFIRRLCGVMPCPALVHPAIVTTQQQAPLSPHEDMTQRNSPALLNLRGVSPGQTCALVSMTTYNINSYSIRTWSSRSTTNLSPQTAVAGIFLYDGTTYRGYAYFFPDGTKLAPPVINSSGGRVYVHYNLSKFDAMVQMLREEKPVYLYEFGVNNAGLMSGREPTGEEEGVGG